MLEKEPIIIAEDVHKWYDKYHVLRGANLTVNPGEVVVLMGLLVPVNLPLSGLLML